jgi:Pregnancy-associated plasma protein-A/Secretion system C-terminal sorting domain
MKRTPLIILFFLISHFSFSQKTIRCAHQQHHDYLMATNPEYFNERGNIESKLMEMEQTGKRSTNAGLVVTIPVVFHIIYNTAAENISTALINEQMDVMNDDFARLNANAVNTPGVFSSLGVNTGIQFCLAQRDPNGNATTGILRVQTALTSVPTFPSSISAPWNRDNYLNIYVANFSSGVLGVAPYPGGPANSDYVNVLFSTVGGPNLPGSYIPYHLGRTATHEIGHWLNLIHIWGDDSDINGVCSANECSGSDQVSDTPNQCDCHYGNPSFPQVTCSNGPNGDMFMNYMDYSDDAAMNIFSLGQSTRMNNSISVSRSSLLSSQGCIPLSINQTDDFASLTISPNPTDGKFSINYNLRSTSNITVTISDLTGRNFLKEEIQNAKIGQKEFYLNAPAGCYFARIISSNGNVVKRIITY